MKRLRTEEKIAIGVSRRHAKNAPTVLRSEIYCFPTKNNIYYFTIVMPMKLDFVLIDAINDVIGKVLENGLVMHWNILTQEYTQNAIMFKFIMAEGRFDGENDRQALTFDHIAGAFVIIGIGWSLAFIAFVMEKIVKLRLKSESKLKIWRWLNNLLKAE